MSDSLSNKHKLLYFILASLVIIMAVGTSLYALGLFEGDGGSTIAEGEPEKPYRHISMSEAQTSCEQHAQDVFGQRLYLLNMDKFSSRLDKKDERYKLFFEAELFASPARQGYPQLYYVNCFTGTQSPDVRNFEYSADGQDFVKPGEEQRGLFGV